MPFNKPDHILFLFTGPTRQPDPAGIIPVPGVCAERLLHIRVRRGTAAEHPTTYDIRWAINQRIQEYPRPGERHE